MDKTATTATPAVEEKKPLATRGVIVEFDFAALDGSKLLFETAKKQFAEIGVDLTPRLEAEHLAGGSYQGAIAELLQALKKKNDPAKVARELATAFSKALDAKVAAAVTPAFKAFVKALVAKGVKVVISTRANVETLKPAFADFDPALVTVYAEPSLTYGSIKWDAWRRACIANKLHECITVAVTGSGLGVKAALVGGLAAVAVANPRLAYQDYGGADAVVDEISTKLVPDILRVLHLD